MLSHACVCVPDENQQSPEDQKSIMVSFAFEQHKTMHLNIDKFVGKKTL